MKESLRPLFERFLVWADECPDVRAAIIEWPEDALDRSQGSPDVHITVIASNSRRQLSTTWAAAARLLLNLLGVKPLEWLLTDASSDRPGAAMPSY